jgi:hypothetical protein
MKRIGIILAILAAAFLLIGGGKYTGMVIMAVLMPIYSLLLASVIFIVFLITAAIAVPIGRKLTDWAEARTEKTATSDEERKAA